jgi:hypothetical protein
MTAPEQEVCARVGGWYLYEIKGRLTERRPLRVNCYTHAGQRVYHQVGQLRIGRISFAFRAEGFEIGRYPMFLSMNFHLAPAAARDATSGRLLFRRNSVPGGLSTVRGRSRSLFADREGELGRILETIRSVVPMSAHDHPTTPEPVHAG